MEKLITVKEAAEMMGITSENYQVTIYRKVAAKKLRAYRPAKKLMFKRSDVEAYINKTVVR